MARSKSSNRWMSEHFDDHYVKMAQQKGLRSRSAFKLLELQEKYALIKPGMVVVDLGSAPGGWCQVVLPLVGKSGRLVALDILEMEPIDGVDFILGDFTEEESLQALEQVLEGRKVDLVLSDMAPNISGNAAIDQPRSIGLAELALEFAGEALAPGGSFLTKLFQGEGFMEYVAVVKKAFRTVKLIKPKASRAESREIYLLARHYRIV